MASGFEFNKLCATFSEICPDFGEPHQTDKSQSVDFAYKVLFELGPSMWKLKQNGSAQMWRLIFNENASVYIYSYSFQRSVNVNPQLHDKKLYLTLKQAGLLAASKMCSLLLDKYNPRNKILLTPLARAVFLPENIPKIAVELETLLARKVDINEVTRTIISSCQTDGFHLEHSRCHIALVAIEVTVSAAAQRQKLREKTIRLYAKHGKTFDEAHYNIFVKYAKLSARAAESATPQPNADDQSQSKGKSIDAVLRGIAKSADDPLSGGTLDIEGVKPSTNSKIDEMYPITLKMSFENIKIFDQMLQKKKNI